MKMEIELPEELCAKLERDGSLLLQLVFDKKTEFLQYVVIEE